MNILIRTFLAISFTAFLLVPGLASAARPTNFVVQLTASEDNHSQLKALQQVERAIHDIGADKVHFTVVAYEEGVSALLSNNLSTSQLRLKLADQGVIFEAGLASMKTWNFKKADFPIEVNFVPSGASEVVRLQMRGYKYWQP